MIVTVKSYGDELFKITYLKHGISKRKKRIIDYDNDLLQGGSERAPPEDGEKELCNLYRAKAAVKEYALCNDWAYFVTITLDKRKQDRYDLDGYVKDLGVWIGNYNKKFGCKLKYLLIPEQHQDGAWHMHGLFGGVSVDSVVMNKHGYLDMPYYAERFGYISLDKLRDSQRAATYITKYVAKAMTCTEVKLCKHSYYHSHGLERAVEFGRGRIDEIPSGAWENEYCGIEWLTMEEFTKRAKEFDLK